MIEEGKPPSPLDASPEAAVERWLEDAIIGLQLCPFAAKPWREGLIRIATSHAVAPEDAVHDVLEEAWMLLQPEPDLPEETPLQTRPQTTLIAFSDPTLEFETLLDIAATVEDLIDQAGGVGMLQFITFHPEYRFEGEDADELGAWTNRSPVPVIHILREDEVTRAVEQHPDTLSIPERNVALLREMGLAKLQALWKTFGAQARPPKPPVLN